MTKIPGSTSAIVSVADVYGGDVTIPPDETYVAFRLPEAGERVIAALGYGVCGFLKPDSPRSPRIILAAKEGA